ncbi:uncharacterized protein LOC121705786 isoform X1 [Alosa sapidissima]|uniref:uncharacterized protein LOC121705786 isoform X1 n=1 Tax=Alosa sapidissima TaxID=34773 RepID=UPI001C083853|nr:uncharacterized protein LOC121705786 isoform X1 [Alosa sapidissima]
MDEESGMSTSKSLQPAAEGMHRTTGALVRPSVLDEMQALRAQISTQAWSIDSLSKTLSALQTESNQNTAAIAQIQAELFNLAKHLSGQRLEERFEALHCEVSSELHYLRSLLLPSSSPGPSSVCLPSSSKPYPVNNQSQAGLSHLAQELYHSRRILWEQIGELRKEMHDIQYQLNYQREDVQRKLTERCYNDRCMESVISCCMEKDDTLHRSQNGADISQLQKSLQKITISKGKAPIKPRRVFKPITTSDSDDSSTHLAVMSLNIKKEMIPTARRK